MSGPSRPLGYRRVAEGNAVPYPLFVLEVSGSMRLNAGPGVDPGGPQDPSKLSRMDMAKEELAKTVRDFPDGKLFNLVSTPRSTVGTRMKPMPSMITALSAIALLTVVSVQAQDAGVPSERELRKKLQVLRVPDVAWRQISWKTCLIEGLIEAKLTKKPLMLWCQIDRPVDDTRC